MEINGACSISNGNYVEISAPDNLTLRPNLRKTSVFDNEELCP